MTQANINTDDCWHFAGNIQNRYGSIYSGGRGIGVHRVMYEALVGEIPQGLVIDHLCRVPRCINPQHLEPVTNVENVMRGETVGAINLRKTVCHAGHPFNKQNTYITNDNRRQCKLCNNFRHRRQWWNRKKLAVSL